MIELNCNIIRGKIAEKGTSQKRLAVEMGITPQSLSRKLTGKRQFTVDEAAKLCSLLEIPTDKRAEIFLL